MGKISVADGGSDRITGEGMPVPVDGTSYDDTPGVQGPPPEAPAEFSHSHGEPYRAEGSVERDRDASEIEDSAGQHDEDEAQYDPGEHTVADVNAYVAARSAAGDSAEVQRVLDAERAGRNRKGVQPDGTDQA